jgi:2,4-diketo-3-deoxy-L-fuconate hydrolase
MGLVSVLRGGRRVAGVLDGDRVLVSELDGGIDALIAAGGDAAAIDGEWHAAEDVVLDAALRPPVVLCAGQNYRDHLDEKAPVDVAEPEFFLKAGQTIAAPGDACVLDPAVTAKLDYETELGVVIGRGGRHIPARDAADHIYGYIVLNDLTARDRQVVSRPDGGFAMALGPGKNFDGATRVAASLVPAADLDGDLDLRLTTSVDGELRQSNSMAAMVFGVPEVIAYLSRLMTLRPGAVIATGTPGGTGWGTDAELGGTSVTPPGCVPGRYLRPGDHVISEIERIGRLEFDVVGP